MRIILDTDLGNDIDDTFALYYLLKEARGSLALVLTEYGHTKKRANMICRFLKKCGAEEIPVGAGVEKTIAEEPYIPYMYRFLSPEEQAERYPILENGLEKAKELIERYDDVVIVAIGPTENLAALAEICPKARTVPVCAMLGSIYVGYPGEEGPHAEWNVKADIPAARKTLASYENLTLAPLDTCGQIRIRGDAYRRFLNSRNPVSEEYRTWLGLGFHSDPDRSSILYDTQPVYMLLDGSLLEYETLSLRCGDDGRLFQDPAGHPVKAAMRWKDLKAYEDRIAGLYIDADPRPEGERWRERKEQP